MSSPVTPTIASGSTRRMASSAACVNAMNFSTHLWSLSPFFQYAFLNVKFCGSFQIS